MHSATHLECFDNQWQQLMTDNLSEPQRLTTYEMTNDHQGLNSVASLPVLTEPIKQVLTCNNIIVTVTKQTKLIK